MKLLAVCRLQNSLGENFRKGGRCLGFPPGCTGQALSTSLKRRLEQQTPPGCRMGATRTIPEHLQCARHSAKYFAHIILFNPQTHLAKRRDTPFQRRMLRPNPYSLPGGGEVRSTALTQPPVHPTPSTSVLLPRPSVDSEVPEGHPSGEEHS